MMKLKNELMKEVDSELEHLDPRKRFKESNVKRVKKLKEGTTENSFLVESATGDLFILKKFCHFSDAKSILNIIEEIISLCNCEHVNIAKFYGYDYSAKTYDNKQFYDFSLLLEYSELTLEDIIGKTPNILDASKMKDLIGSLLNACNYLYKKGIVHGDITLENVIYTNQIFKLSFAGEGFLLNRNSFPFVRTSFTFMSPELYDNRYSFNNLKIQNHNMFKSDVYSLGLVFLYAACDDKIRGLNNGKNPYNRETILELLNKVEKRYSGACKTVIGLMLVGDPSKRLIFNEILSFAKNSGQLLDNDGKRRIDNLFENESVEELKKAITISQEEIEAVKQKLEKYEKMVK